MPDTLWSCDTYRICQYKMPDRLWSSAGAAVSGLGRRVYNICQRLEVLCRGSCLGSRSTAWPAQWERPSETARATECICSGIHMLQVHFMAYEMAKAVGDRTRAAWHMEQTWECSVLAWGSSAPLVASYAAKMQVSCSQPLFVSVCLSFSYPPTYFSLSPFSLSHNTHVANVAGVQRAVHR